MLTSYDLIRVDFELLKYIRII